MSSVCKLNSHWIKGRKCDGNKNRNPQPPLPLGGPSHYTRRLYHFLLSFSSLWIWSLRDPKGLEHPCLWPFLYTVPCSSSWVLLSWDTPTSAWDAAPRALTPPGDWKGDRRPLKQGISVPRFQTLGLDPQYLELHMQTGVCMHHTETLPLLTRAWKPLTGKDDNYRSNSWETSSNSLCLVAPVTTRAC